MFEALVVGFLAVLVIELYFVILGLYNVGEYAKGSYRETLNVKRQVSTRQNRAGMQSGARVPEQDYEALGRESVSSRVVVGGDDASQLNKDLGSSRRGSGNTARVGGDFVEEETHG